MSDKKISELTASTTPLAGTEVLPIVQSGGTKKTSVESLLTSVQPSGTANGVIYLNGSKVATSGSALLFDGANLGVGALSSGWSTAGKAVQIPYLSIFGITNNQSQEIANGYLSSGSTKYIASQPITRVRHIQGDIEWATAPLGTAGTDATITRRLKLSNAGDLTLDTGNLVIGTAGKGIDFSASTNAAGMTSELLSDYEEGTWTPTISLESNVSSTTVVEARYTKIGNIVNCRVDMDTSVTATDAEARFAMTLPFSAHTAAHYSVGSAQIILGAGLNRSGVGVVTQMSSGATQTYVVFASNQLAATGAAVWLRATFTYEAA